MEDSVEFFRDELSKIVAYGRRIVSLRYYYYVGR